MLYTCSPALLGATAVLALTSVTALTTLTGCTIYTNSGPPPRQPAYAAPAPAQPPPATGLILGNRTPANPTVVGTPASPPPVATGAPRITSANAFGSGTTAAFRGLAYVIPTGSRTLPNLDSLVPFATLFTDSFDIAPQSFTAGFPGALMQTEWFAIRYDGSFALPVQGPCAFDVVSDDGAILYIDGQPVVNNDGIHPAARASGKATLRAGIHQLRLDYFKSSQGTVALRVFVTVGQSPQSLLVGVPAR